MAISYLLAPIPKWIIVGNDGLTAGGAKLYTKSSLNKIVDKAVYADPAGTIPYTNPIIFDANGTQGPFYWSTDSVNPSDTYYLEVYDSDDNLLWTLDDYFPPGEGGGGGNTTTYVDINNYVINGLFWRYFSSDSFVSGSVNTVIAPGAHAALTEVTTSTNGATGPDIRFIKSNATSTDRIRFVNFAQGSDPFTDDVTPAWSLRFTCSVSGTETYKYIQIPITQNVNQIDNQTMTFVMWARTETGTANVDIDFRQFYGSSGGGADTFSSASTCALTTSWTRFVKTIAIPTANGAIGACGNDALYLRINFPVGVTDFYIAKPQLYLGNISPEAVINSFDDIDAVLNVPRTADLQMTLRASAPLGWTAMNDQSIGSSSSGATNRANTDTFPLYKELYLNVSDTYAPVSGGRTAPGNDITACITDFALNKPITLTRTLGRLIGGTGSGSGLTARVLGEYLGSENAIVVAHTHNATVDLEVLAVNAPAGGTNVFVPGTGAPQNVAVQSTGSSGTGANMPPSVFYTILVKL